MQRGDRLMQIMSWSRYVDTWSKRDGRWAIDHRVAIMDLDEIRDVTPLGKNSRGSRDTSDPSYAVLGRERRTVVDPRKL